MQPFRPIFLPLFAKQRRALLASKGAIALEASPLVRKHLENLTNTASGDAHPQSIWRPAISVAMPLIRKTILLCSLSALLMLCCVIILRHLLSFDLPFNTMIAMCCLVFLIEIVDHLIKYFDMLRRADIARVIQLHLIARIHDKILKLESSVIGSLDKGNLKTLVSSDVESVEDFITAASSNWIPTFTLVLVMTPYLYATLGVVGLVGVFVTLLQIPASMAFALIIEKMQARAQAQQDALASIVGEWVRHVRLVRILGWQNWIAKRISEIVRRYTTETAFKHAITCVTYGLSFGWWLLVAFSMLITNWKLGNPLPVVDFFASLWALGHLSNYVQFVPYAISLFGSAAAGAKRLRIFFGTPESSVRFDTGENKTASLEPIVAIELENVSVIFDGKAALDELSCRIDLTKKVAILGEIASGKSILLEILLGERFPDTGKVWAVLASGKRHSLWERNIYNQVRSSIAFCPAEPYISNSTLRQNIDIWDKADENSLSDVLEGAHLVKDIKLFNKGLNEEIGELGINLSGGQKQRTSLARAFLSGRKIFFLDDPLSAVDVLTERALFDELLKRAHGLVLVSHRLSELHRLDWLIVMEQGKIIEQGPPQKLIADPSSAFSRYREAHQNEEIVETAV